ncbi:MAG: DedA family protein [Bdellovibrio sp. CG10_big_fil_rev_8_21_14_0_10_47_8]|nr:MAG: DedA family protein [Bdellovibrio sp. CG10_big_fil_rev_8_21_14_0_10_47_8]
MHFGHEPIFQWLAQYAYEPSMVYIGVFVLMIASGFGFPLPEEVTIVSVGVLAYMGANPALFPPPTVGAPVINGYEAAILVSLAVFFSDNLVYWLGREFGRKIRKMPRFEGFFAGPINEKINRFIEKYGVYAAFVFRFTPGIRFPAHIFLGMSKFSYPAFALVDGIAVLISVPTQILLVYHFGDPILATLYKFKVYVGITLAIIIAYMISKKLWQRMRLRFSR